MEIKSPVRKSPNISKKLEKRYAFFEKLTEALNKHTIPDEIGFGINSDIDRMNSMPDSSKEKPRAMRKLTHQIMKKVQKELELVPKNYHRNLWMGIGMAAFGIPMGTAFGVSMENMGFMGIGLPIGLVIGLAVGTELDKKAEKNGKQLDIDYEM